jgi:hypothetical protein
LEQELTHDEESPPVPHHIERMSAGFSTVAWVDDTEWMKGWLAAAFGGSQPSGPGIAMLIDDGLTRVINLSAAVQSGAVQIYRGAFVKG